MTYLADREEYKEGWVAKLVGCVAKLIGWLGRFVGMGAKLVGWVAKFVGWEVMLVRNSLVGGTGVSVGVMFGYSWWG
jgi:hypothetical protein